MDISLSPNNVARTLAWCIAVLAVLSLATVFIWYGLGHPRALGFVWMFDVGGEQNVPALFSTMLMFVIAGIAFVLAWAERANGLRDAWGWFGIGVIFVFLGIDETAMLHEKLAAPLRENLGVGGLLFFAWILPYGIAVGLLVVGYFRFVMRLPGRCTRLVIASAAVYLGGALVMEALNGAHFETMSDDGILGYVAMVMVEEIAEMAGLAMFLHAELEYAVTVFEPVSVRLARSE
jgi:hypothetical protein